MRIAFLAEAYPPIDGGVATSAQRVAKGLVALGADVHVFCFDNSQPISAGDYVLEEIDEGVVVSRIGPFFLKQRDLNLNLLSEKMKASLRRRAFNQILRLIGAGKIDVVVSFYLMQAGYLGQFLSRQLGVPHVAGVRGNDIGLNIFHVERFAVTQWIVTGAQKIICVNEHLRDRLLLAFPWVKDRTCVIPNSVAVPVQQAPDEGARQGLLKTTGWNDTDFILCFIGTLREKKGIVTLLNALHRVRQLPVRLLVIGQSVRNADAALCGDLLPSLADSNHLFFTGKVDRRDVRNWALGTDAVVMPSSDDGLANGLLEGMALGLCPIVSEIFSNVVHHGENGLLVPSDDVNSLAASFTRVASDRTMARTWGQKSRELVEKVHKPDAEASAYMTVLERVVDGWRILFEE